MKKLFTLMMIMGTLFTVTNAQILSDVLVDGTPGHSARVTLQFTKPANWVEITWNLENQVTGSIDLYGVFTSNGVEDSVFTIEGTQLGGAYKLLLMVTDGDSIQELSRIFQTPTVEQTGVAELSEGLMKMVFHGSDFVAVVDTKFIDGQIQVLNLEGQVVAEAPITATTVQVTAPTTPPGIYLVRVINGNRYAAVRKIMKS